MVKTSEKIFFLAMSNNQEYKSVIKICFLITDMYITILYFLYTHVDGEELLPVSYQLSTTKL